MKQHMLEALNKLADLKNYVIEMEHLSDPPEETFKWGTDPFYAAHRNVSLELMHKGHTEDAWKLFDDFVNYQHPTRIEEARADMEAVANSLVPLTPDNIERLWREHKGTIVMTDIFFKAIRQLSFRQCIRSRAFYDAGG